MIYNYIKIAFRSLWVNKLFSAINIVGLSIGMAAAMIIFIWVQNELSFDKYHKDADRIYHTVANLDFGTEMWHFGSVPIPFVEDARREVPEIEQLAIAKSNRDRLIDIGTEKDID